MKVTLEDESGDLWQAEWDDEVGWVLAARLHACLGHARTGHTILDHFREQHVKLAASRL